MWPKFLRSYFGFTKQQGRGLFVLVCFCAGIVLFRLFLPLFETKPNLLLNNLPNLIRDTINSPEKKNPAETLSTKQQLKLFVFDPNTIPYDQVLQLGIKPSSAKAWLNFRNKGFVFRAKKDLMKVYGVTSEDYERLEPFIKITSEANRTEARPVTTPTVPLTQPKKTSVKTIELNSADSLTLLELNGIGPTFAKRIIKYRDLLGGFSNINQLKEVYGFTDESFEKIAPNITINAGLIRKLRLNTADFKTLNRHPYLSYELTKQVVNARKKQPLDEGAFKALINDEALFQKLSPYCSFD